MSKSSGKATSAANELSLIDFDADAGSATNGAANGAAGSSSQAGGLENDLLGLSLGDNGNSFGQGGGISLGFGANQNIPGPALLSSITQNSNAGGGPVSSPTPPPFSPFSGFVSQPSTSQSSTPQPSLLQQSAFSQPAPQQKTTNDPFAALASAQLSSSKPSTPKPATPAIAAPPAPAATTTADDDEWSFSSALPPEAPSLPAEHKVTVKDQLLQIDMQAKRSPQNPGALALLFAFSNNTPMPISNLHYQLAVTKGYVLQLQPQTGRALQPNQKFGVTQAIQVAHAGNVNNRVESIKLRWRVAYTLGSEAKTEMGEIPEFGIA